MSKGINLNLCSFLLWLSDMTSLGFHGRRVLFQFDWEPYVGPYIGFTWKLLENMYNS